MKKLQFAGLILLVILACGAPVQRQAQIPAPLPKDDAKSLFKTAKKHIGEPYHYGGTSPRGWDCSGYVGAIYRNALNLLLPRSSSEMHAQCHQLSTDRKQPGDLVFFRFRQGKPSHVGIYMGGSKFIHVSKSSGVRISSLEEPYYRRTFIAFGRPDFRLLASRR